MQSVSQSLLSSPPTRFPKCVTGWPATRIVPLLVALRPSEARWLNTEAGESEAEGVNCRLAYGIAAGLVQLDVEILCADRAPSSSAAPGPMMMKRTSRAWSARKRARLAGASAKSSTAQSRRSVRHCCAATRAGTARHEDRRRLVRAEDRCGDREDDLARRIGRRRRSPDSYSTPARIEANGRAELIITGGRRGIGPRLGHRTRLLAGRRLES